MAEAAKIESGTEPVQIQNQCMADYSVKGTMLKWSTIIVMRTTVQVRTENIKLHSSRILKTYIFNLLRTAHSMNNIIEYAQRQKIGAK